MKRHQYFITCATVDEVKALYTQLITEQFANDGENAATIETINAEYFDALKANDGKTVIGDDDQPHTYTLNEDHEEAITEKIAALLALNLPTGIDIILIGKWVWVTGIAREDKASQALLKKEKLIFHGKRKAWYWKPYAVYFGRRNHKATSTDDIAARYGAQHFKRQAVAA